MAEKRAIVELDNKLANRSVNEGFSGGEKKRNEIFQMAMLEPTFAILDETDSGLDVHSSAISSEEIAGFQARRPKAYQLACAKGCPHQFLSVPILATPATALNEEGATKRKNSFHMGAR